MSEPAPIVAVWNPRWLWNKSGYHGLALRADRTWSLVKVKANVMFFSSIQVLAATATRNQLVRSDAGWDKAFIRIIQHGLLPSKSYTGVTCSCGSWSVHGEGNANHPSSCSFHDTYDKFLLPTDAPDNNDGLTHCYICTMRTRTHAGRYQLCQNDQCRWHKN